jgi:hypothetical protein
MKLIQFKHRYDLGHDWYVQILNISRHWPKLLKERSVLQLSVSWCDYPSWFYMQITSGMHGILGVMICVYKFGFDFDILSKTWNWDRLRELDNGNV